MEDKQILAEWYRYASRANGFIGAALRAQRIKTFLTQEQQRAMLQILGEHYSYLWLRLQAMPLPRADQFVTDVQRIVATVTRELEEGAPLDGERLGELIQEGLSWSESGREGEAH